MLTWLLDYLELWLDSRVKTMFCDFLVHPDLLSIGPALLGHMMCAADWLLPGRHNHQESTVTIAFGLVVKGKTRALHGAN